MKGIYVINSLEGGGAERVFATLISLIAADEKRDFIEIVILDETNEVYKLPKGIIIHRLVGRNPLLKFIRYLNIVGKIQPDYVVSFLTRANNFNVLGALVYGYQSLISERSNTAGRLCGRFVKLKRGVVKYFYSRADGVIAVSRGVKNCLVDEFSLAPSKIYILNNGVDIQAIENRAKTSGLSIDKPYIVAMGRLVSTKGFDCLLRAYSNANIKAELRILGDGPEKVRLKALSKKLKIEHKVHFEGFKDNPHQYILHSLFFVLPSELEGFPNALVEALALKKAVLSTDCADGPSEILELTTKIGRETYRCAKYGVLVNVHDQFALAKGLRLLEHNKLLREGYEKLANDAVEKYSHDQFYLNFKGILSAVVSTRTNLHNSTSVES